MILPADVFKPLPRSQEERVAILAASIGRQTADLAALIFDLPMTAELRRRFERETLDEIGAILDDCDALSPADRRRFQEIATLAFDRRLSVHAARYASGSA